MSEVLQRMEQKAIKKLTEEIRESVTNTLHSMIDDKIGYGTDNRSIASTLAASFISSIQERIKIKALSTVQANFAELMDLLQQALDKESEK